MIGVNIVSVIILLGILIFAHELGHFLMAKYFRVGVLKFSLGFGRKLVGRKVGETEYLISLIPLGGYVKLLGESETEELSAEERRRSFMEQSVWRRMAIVAAGPAFNFLLALIVFFIVNMVGVPVLSNVVGTVMPGSAAQEAGLVAGDVIEAVDGVNVSRWDEMAERIARSEGKTLRLTVLRADKRVELAVTPRPVSGRNIFGEEVKVYKIGIGPSPKTVVVRQNPAQAAYGAVKQTWVITKLTVMSIVKILEGVLSPRNLGGPILIAQMAGAQVKEGIIPFILFMAVLSINLGVLNLLPIPILDGGHLFFYAVEALRGRPVSLRWRERAQQVGFVILVLLMIFVFAMDIDRLDIKAVNEVTKFFTK
ncbi:MAG TPA: RIP metalloprotease RseP [Syntrophales bacterium]|nr:RIP metalloprotease RseP [Syntrophales bacterium]